MATLIEISKFAKEQRLSIHVPGTNCIVVSGYGDIGSQLTGDSDSDYIEVEYIVTMTVGPEWEEIRDVSPIVAPAGFMHWSSDTADATGYRIESCIWKKVPGQAAGTERIQLEVKAYSRGGPDAQLLVLAYHLIANGKLASGAQT